MKKILITGGSGFLGNFFKNSLKKNYIVKTIGRSNKNNHMINLLDNKKVNFFFKRYKFDYILHCAGHVPGKQNLLNKKHYIQNNMMTENIVKYSNSKIVFFSTYKVYNNSARVGYPFKINCFEITDYASSKILSENFIMQQKKDYLILRLPTIFGQDVKNGLLFKTIKNNYTNNKLNQNWCVLDVNRILPPVIKYLDKRLKYGIYNLSYKLDSSFDIILNKVFKILNKKTRVAQKKKFFLQSKSTLSYNESDLEKDLIKYKNYILKN